MGKVGLVLKEHQPRNQEVWILVNSRHFLRCYDGERKNKRPDP